MLEIAKEMLASTKFSGIFLLLFSFTQKFSPHNSLVLKQEDFSEDDVPGDNFPPVLMNRHFEIH